MNTFTNARIMVIFIIFFVSALYAETKLKKEFSLGTVDYNKISNDEYVRIKDGHFWVNGKRLKLWGCHGDLGIAKDEIDRTAVRYSKMGFNLYRTNTVSRNYRFDEKFLKDSFIDEKDYTFFKVAENGGYIWLDFLNMFRVIPSDANLICDPDISKEDWLEAMNYNQDKFGKISKPSYGVLNWDSRMQEAYFNFIDRLMLHVNPYRGLSYAQDPSIAVIELVNEQWFIPNMLGGSFIDLHPAIVKSLTLKWNRWLASEYHTNENLRKSWGKLLPFEELELQSVLLLPLLGDKALDKMSDTLGVDIKYKNDFPDELPSNEQRGRDVVKFLIDLNIKFKQKAIARLRSHGMTGRTAKYVPILLDTGASYCPQSAFEHTYGSAFACATYLNMIDPDKSKETYPWSAPLKEKPALSNWLSQNKIINHPALIYETMTFAPAKYRADYPLRLLAMMTIQDFDGACWHYYTPVNPTDTPLFVPTPSHYWNGVHFGNDEIMQASLSMAANIFRYGDLVPPETPVTLVVGRDIVYDMNPHWTKVKEYLEPTVFSYGLRLKFDLEQEKSYFVGDKVTFENIPNVASPTEQINYYWKEGYLVVESERVKILAGFVPENYTFKSGEKLTGITVQNQKKSPYVIPAERYICFAMCSKDNKPLRESREILVSAVSTSWNTDFQFDINNWCNLQKERNHPPLNASYSVERGTLPILVNRVGYTFNASWLKGMNVKIYDFNFNTINDYELSSPKYEVSSSEKVFLLEIKK